jgi:hypothetical protein
MTHKDERNRPNLRLVVNNPDLRKPLQNGEQDDFIPLDELITQRDQLRPHFYYGLKGRQTRVCRALERYFEQKGWLWGLDPHHGQIMVLPAVSLCPEMAEEGDSPKAEILVYVADDAVGDGLSLSLEIILPFFSDDEAVMEEALLFAPVFQYGTLFLEENRRDGLLDLIYRIGFPLYPAAPTTRLFDRFFLLAAYELSETLHALAEYPEQ